MRYLRRCASGVFVVLGLLGSGCTSVRVSSYADPEYRNVRLARVAVMALVEDLGWRQSLERAMVEELTRNGLDAVMAMDIAPPTRSWTQETLLEHLRSQGCEGIVQMELLQQGQRLESVLVETITRIYQKGRETQEVRTQTQELQARQYAGLGARLYRIPSGEVLWLASAYGRNNFSASGLFVGPDYEERYLLRALARRIARELVRERRPPAR